MSNFSIADFDAAVQRLWDQGAQPDWEIRHPDEVAEWRANIDRAVADGTYSGTPGDYDPRWLLYQEAKRREAERDAKQ